MADQVEVKLSHPHNGHDVGDRLELDALEAKNLVRAGIATYATARAAKKAEGNGGAAKSASAVQKQA